MPQPRILDFTQSEQRQPTGIESFFSKLGKSYQNESDRVEIGKLLDEYKANRENANAWEDLQIGLEQSDISPSRRLETQRNLNGLKNTIREKDRLLNDQVKTELAREDKKRESLRKQQSVYELYKPYLGDEEAKRLSEIDSEATARSKIAQISKANKPEAPSAFERTLETEEAKKLIKLEEEIPKARDALLNLDRIESLAENELSGVKGFAKAILGTESAKEMQNLSFTAIEPIIKLFNPVGPIPVQKVKIIQQQFQAHPGDLLTTIKGKTSALRRIGNQALARAEERAGLIRKHKGRPPEEELKEFDKQSSNLQDALVDQESFNLKFKEKSPDDLIEGLYSVSNGRKLKPITKKEAQKLYDQGLITNVPNR